MLELWEQTVFCVLAQRRKETLQQCLLLFLPTGGLGMSGEDANPLNRRLPAEVVTRQKRLLPELESILERRLLSVSCRDSLMVFRWIVDPNFQLHMAFCVACWPFLRGSEKNSREQWWGWTTGPLDMAWAGPASLFWAGWWLTWCPVALPGPGGSEDSSILEARGSCQMAVQGAGQTVMSKPSKMYTPKSGAKFMTFPGLRASSFSWGT